MKNSNNQARQVRSHTRRQGLRWLYFTTISGAFGARQLGDEWLCVVDDFGDLVPVERAQ